MIFPDRYSILGDNSSVADGDYSIVPIRFKDRMDIMNWRNEQIYHLRQKTLLTEKDQEHYFKNSVSKLFEQEQPNQLLFSYLKGEQCIGYGGLVHINWEDRVAEISFIMDTMLEKEHFNFHWKTYLGMIEKVAFRHLRLHKIFTYAYDLRPHLYDALEEAGFEKEAELKEHMFYEGKHRSVLIHKRLNPYQISFRNVEATDKWTVYNWSSEALARKNSFQSGEISRDDHNKWFDAIIQDQDCLFLVFQVNEVDAGFVRFQKKEDHLVVGINVDTHFRGMKLGSSLLRLASEQAVSKFALPVYAYIKEENQASVRSFEKAGYDYLKNDVVNDTPCLVYQYERK